MSVHVVTARRSPSRKPSNSAAANAGYPAPLVHRLTTHTLLPLDMGEPSQWQGMLTAGAAATGKRTSGQQDGSEHAIELRRLPLPCQRSHSV